MEKLTLDQRLDMLEAQLTVVMRQQALFDDEIKILWDMLQLVEAAERVRNVRG